jgi:cell volume regulation protein A
MFGEMELAILVGSLLVVLAIFTSVISFRLGAPLLLVFLAVGLLAGVDGIGGINFGNERAAYYIGSIALAVILFDSGFETRLQTIRLAATQSLLLATAGVLLTALIVGLAAKLLYGFDWATSILLGAIVSPTDAAAVFLLLRVGGITLRDRVRATLEVESGSNDPMAIFLTVTLVQIITLPAGESALGELALQFLLQIGLGTLFGVAGGWVLVRLIQRSNFEPGLYPILMLAMALVIFGLTALLHGSGFLAVYLAGIFAGNVRLRHAVAMRRFNNGITWFAQIAMFVLLGLLATPSEFGTVLLPASILAIVLMLIARPIAVWACLSFFGFSRQEVAFVAWVGLRGAVSILLAILPRLNDLPNGQAVFNSAFLVVLLSLLIQGWTIRPVAKWLGLIVPARQGPVERIELELGRGDHEVVVYRVHPESRVAKGERVPRWARPSLILRDGHSLKPHSAGRLKSNDQVYIVAASAHVGLLDRLFTAAPKGADPALYGEFVIEPDVHLVDLAQMYGATFAPADAETTVREYLRRELQGDIEPGDRVSLGQLDIIVRRTDEDHRILEVGLAVESVPQVRPRIPVFQTAAEIKAWLRGMKTGRAERRRAREMARKAEVIPPEKVVPPEKKPPA